LLKKKTNEEPAAQPAEGAVAQPAATTPVPLNQRRTVDIITTWTAEEGYKARMLHAGEHTDLPIGAESWQSLPEGFIPTEYCLFLDTDDVLCVASRQPGAGENVGRKYKIGKGANDAGKAWKRVILVGPNHIGHRPKPNQNPMNESKAYSIAQLEAELAEAKLKAAKAKLVRDKARKGRKKK
jgi:hypothetical protein